MEPYPKVDIWTDGATYPGNPGDGGWGAILIFKSKIEETRLLVSGIMLPGVTTNNQAETRAVIEAIKLLKRPCEVTIFTDSQYVCFGLEKIIKLVSFGKNGKYPKANVELWNEMEEVLRKGKHQVHISKVRGHANIKLNELADELAYSAAANRIEARERRVENAQRKAK